MQNAGQYGHGAPGAHPSSQFVPSQTSPTGGSTTSSLRQFRKKDVLDKSAPDSSHSIPESQVARVAPHNHYPPKTNDNYRYPYHQFSEYNIGGPPSQVKYSEIADMQHHQNTNNVPTSVIQKPKNKEYMEMCNLQQSQVKPAYQEHLSNQQNFSHENTQYYPKETPQQVYPGYKPENQYYPKEQYHHQMAQPIPKYSPVPPTHMGKYPPQENPFLSKLRRIHPNMAMSIINDHSGIDQREMYAAQNQNRYYQGAMQHNPYNSSGYPMNHYSNYPNSCNYASRPPPQMSSVPRFPMSPHMERSMSPRRTYPENIPLPMNYSSVPQKTPISPNYPQYSAPEYSQHYQHRRAPSMPQEYLQQHYRPQYMPGHQIPVEEMPEMSENHGAASKAIKQFIENFDAEEDAVDANPMENVPSCKDTPKIADDTTSTGTVYMISASELQYFENGIPLIASESGIPLTTEYIVKSGVSLDNGMVRLVENNKNAHPEMSSTDRIVNIHITEAPRPPDCMMTRQSNPNVVQTKNLGESDNKKIIVHQNTVVYQGNTSASPENGLTREVLRQKDQLNVFKESKELVDKNCSPINVEHLEKCFVENPISPEHSDSCLNETLETSTTETQDIQDEQPHANFMERRDSDTSSIESKGSSDSSKHMPIIESFDDVGAAAQTNVQVPSNETSNNISYVNKKMDIVVAPLDEVKEEVGSTSTEAKPLEATEASNDVLKSLEEIKEENKEDISEATISKSNTDEGTKKYANESSNNLVSDIKDEDCEEDKTNVRKEIETLENTSTSTNTNSQLLETDVQKIQNEHMNSSFSVNDIINNIGNKIKRSDLDMSKKHAELSRDFVAHEIEYCSVRLYYERTLNKMIHKNYEVTCLKPIIEKQQIDSDDKEAEAGSNSENLKSTISDVQNDSYKNNADVEASTAKDLDVVIRTNNEKGSTNLNESDSLDQEIKQELEDRASLSEEVIKPPEGVQYRHAIKIEESSVLLHLAGELVEVNFTIVDGKKVFTVVPLSDSALVDVNDNYNVPKIEKKNEEPIIIEIDDTEVKDEVVEDIDHEDSVEQNLNQGESEINKSAPESQSHIESETEIPLRALTENVNDASSESIPQPVSLKPVLKEPDLVSGLEEILTKEVTEKDTVTTLEIELPIQEAAMLESGNVETPFVEPDELQSDHLGTPISESDILQSDPVGTLISDSDLLAVSPVILPVDETNEVIITDLSHEEEVILKLDSETLIPLPESDVPEQLHEPEQSDQPEQPDQPEEPDQPVQPDQPAQTDQPEQPDQPGQPDQLEQPDQPEQPDRPEQPDQPEQPEQPEQPDKREQPHEPVSTSVAHLDDECSVAQYSEANKRNEDVVKITALILNRETTEVKQVEPATSTACNNNSPCFYSPQHKSPTIYTKAAKKAYECDLQIPAITTTGDIDTSSKPSISPKDSNNVPISPNDMVSSSKTKRYIYPKRDNEKKSRHTTEKARHKHPKRSLRISEKVKSNNEKKRALKKLLDKQRQRREAKSLPDKDEDNEEFVDFKELLKARKLKKLQKLQNGKERGNDIKRTNLILSDKNSKLENDTQETSNAKNKSEHRGSSKPRKKNGSEPFEEKNEDEKVQDQKSPCLESIKNELKEVKVDIVKIDISNGKTGEQSLKVEVSAEKPVAENCIDNQDVKKKDKKIRSSETVATNFSNDSLVKNKSNKGRHKHEEHKTRQREKEKSSALESDIAQKVAEETNLSTDISKSTKKENITREKDKVHRSVEKTSSSTNASKSTGNENKVREKELVQKLVGETNSDTDISNSTKTKETVQKCLEDSTSGVGISITSATTDEICKGKEKTVEKSDAVQQNNETSPVIKKPLEGPPKALVEQCSSKVDASNAGRLLENSSSAIQINKNSSASQKSPVSNIIKSVRTETRLDNIISPKNPNPVSISASNTKLERKDDIRSNLPHSKTAWLKDPRRRQSGQIIVPSVSELIEENEIVFPKRKLSLEEYNRRKRKLSDDSKSREATVKKQEKNVVPVLENHPQPLVVAASINSSSASKPDSTTESLNLNLIIKEPFVQPESLVKSRLKPDKSPVAVEDAISQSSVRLVDPRLRPGNDLKRKATCEATIESESFTPRKLPCEEKPRNVSSDSSSHSTASKISSRRKSLEQSKAILQCAISQKPKPQERKHRTVSLDTFPGGSSDINLVRKLSCDESKAVRRKASFDDWEETQSPKLSHHKSKEVPECLNKVFSGLLKNSKPLIDISDFKLNPVVAKDETLLAYKEQVDSKLSSLQIQIPKVAKSLPSKSTNDLMQRFLNNDKMTQVEMEKIKEIISFKRKVQQLKSVKSPDNSLSPINPTYEVRKPINEADTIKLHIKKISGKRKGDVVSTVEESFSEDCDSDFTDVSDRPNHSRGDYSVVQYNSLEKGVPKIIIKRKSEPEVTQPVVVLERIDLDSVLDKKQKLC